MANYSSRSHVNCVDTKLRADLIPVDDARYRHPRTRYSSLFNPGVNRSNTYNIHLLSLPQPNHHNLPNFASDQLRPAADVKQYTMHQPSQFKNYNTKHHSKLVPTFPQNHSNHVVPYELDQETPTFASASPSSGHSFSSPSVLGAPLSSSSRNESPTLTETFVHSPVTSGGHSEAGAYSQRLTSKKSRDHLPHARQDQFRSFVLPPATHTTEARQTTLPNPHTFSSFPRPSTDTGAGASHDRHRPVENPNTNRLGSSSSHLMTNSRPIRPLPATLSHPRHPNSLGVQGSNGSSFRSQPDNVHNANSTKQSSLQLRSHIRSISAQQQSVIVGRAVGKLPEGRSDDPANDDLHDGGNTSTDTELTTSSGKGKERESEATESNAPKRKMDDSNDMRKGTVGGPRTPSACDACKSSKVRCSFPDKPMKSGEPSDPPIQMTEQSPSPSNSYTFSNRLFSGCERCVLNGIECRVSGRKKRDPPPSQNDLEQKNDSLSVRLLELLFKRMSPDEETVTVSSSLKQWKHKTEDSFILSTSTLQPALSHAFLPQIPSSTPHYPGLSTVFPSSDSSRNHSSRSLNLPNLPPGISLTDLPPLPVLDRATSRAERESKIDKWITKATERLVKWDHAQSTPTAPPHREVYTSNRPQWEQDLEVRRGQGYEYENVWADATSSPGDDLEGTGNIDEGGDHVLDSDQMLHATRAYVFGERHNDLLEDRPQIPQKRLPPILVDEIITFEDVTKLFDIFFDKINMFFSVCDPAIHSADKVLRSSSFLFTTICAVASKHYTERPELYPELLKYAKRAAGQAIHGPKTVETTQAFLLLGVYMPPSRTFKDDRAYLFFGLAIRRQHTYEPLPSMSETEARRLLNRGRTWLNCFCNDRSISTQMGKATAILIRGPAIPFNLKTWWRSSKWNLPSDIHMCAYADLLSVMAGFHDVVYLDAYSADGRKKPLNLHLVQEYADKVSAVIQEWTDIISSNFPNRTNIKLAWRDNLWPFLGFYAKLVVLSIGLRDGMLQGLTDKNPFSGPSIVVACELLTQVVDRLAKLGYMRYCVEAYFVFMGFAAAFLLKVLRRKFSFMRKPGQEKEIIDLVQRLIDLLGSDEVAIDNRHTPKLYSRFLTDILAQHKKTHMKQVLKSHQNVDSSLPNGQEESTTVQDGASSNVNTYPMEDIQTYVYSPNGPQSQASSDPTLNAIYNNYMGDASPAMDLDIPLPPTYTNDQDILLSMLPLRDPTFWEHPGMPLATNPDAWPPMVDMTHGTGAALYNLNPFQNDQTGNYQNYPSETRIPPEQYYSHFY
ncbi:hypothetical protein Clacol_007266 [Clathrus columnatus]|uniref:Transcription factor domain-containing protein n=1 Tax=Clathrus columnatus TaxID=1419009 RepID=A0AAV5AH96_9AGAM|nr:hypothetical protein Clacol_007266 [Clathrus columnatus]